MERKPVLAVISFPGNNCEVESLRAVRESGMEAVFFRWNDDTSRWGEVDGYFLPGGFSYEDRGRSGMVASREPVMEFLREEAGRGKVIIGNCNGAQILVESGLIPFGNGLRMSLARNAIEKDERWEATGFLSEWVWITPTCSPERCAASGWSGVMPLPIAHGEGRFQTRDRDLLQELRRNDQIAFSYCDANRNISTDPSVTPNGSVEAIAGICNPEGNVVALMPHPERTANGKPYFDSVRRWILGERKGHGVAAARFPRRERRELPARFPEATEIFIDTIIVNNEERTVEQVLRSQVPGITLKQWKYIRLPSGDPLAVLRNLSLFNRNKERAFLRKEGKVYRWNGETKRKEEWAQGRGEELFSGIMLLKRDVPDTGARSLPEGSETGTCYLCRNVTDADIAQSAVQEIFANPHASTLERFVF